MKEQIQTTVLGARSEPSQDGRSIKHIISLSGGQAPSGTQYPAGDYVSFSPEVLAAAQAKVNAGVTTAEVEIKQVPKQRGGGFWTNYNIDGVGDGLAPLAQPAQGGTPVQQAAPQAASQPHPVLAQASEERSEMNRRSAVHAATELTAALLQTGTLMAEDATKVFQNYAEAMTAYVETGSWSLTDVGPIQPTASTPQEVAQQLPEGTPVQVGVPFDAAPVA